ncbi:MAG: hypothetical protein ACPG5W_09305, partial [Flavobacteriales bacterium]
SKCIRVLKRFISSIIYSCYSYYCVISINTWNKQQTIKANNKIYCSELLEELKLNITRLQFLAFTGDNENNIPSWEEVVENSDSLLNLVTRGLQEEDLDFLLNNKIWAGGSQLNLHDATYEELLGTGKLYSLGSDSLILGLKQYYKRYEREIEYNTRWTNHALEGMYQIEHSRGKMIIDFNRNSEHFDLQDYPWFFDSKSKEYIDLQLGVRKLYGGQAHHFRKCKELIEETELLIELIEREIQKQNH